MNREYPETQDNQQKNRIMHRAYLLFSTTFTSVHSEFDFLAIFIGVKLNKTLS